MKSILFTTIILLLNLNAISQTKTIHVFVALCDNEHQGIVPVPAQLGNGKDVKSNLYWGAMYGVKSFFKNKSMNWELVSTIQSENPNVLERLLFKHKVNDVYMLADAYDGEKIKSCTEDFLKTSNGQLLVTILYEGLDLKFGGHSDLVSYIGHDGLMDFDVDVEYTENVSKPIDVMILACYSKSYFSNEIKEAEANPILWTTDLMAPEAYTLESAIDGWMLNESGTEIEERAAQAYHRYQKCGIKGARGLFTTGY